MSFKLRSSKCSQFRKSKPALSIDENVISRNDTPNCASLDKSAATRGEEENAKEFKQQVSDINAVFKQ